MNIVLRPTRVSGFTLAEYVVATSIVLIAVGAFAVFMQATGVSLVNLTSQSTFNQEAGSTAELIVSRVRLANTATNSSDGDTLTLSFDDDPLVDSDGDQKTWNDKNHYEQFVFETVDGNANTLSDNRLVYKETWGGTSRTLIRNGVRRLPNLNVFSVTNNQATVYINFGLLATNQTPRSQSIEIRTSGRLRNKTE
jgi:hypothetical protein